MARTTNSDTLPYVDSRYELGMLASQRVRDLAGGAEPLVDARNDKPTVIALREIAKNGDEFVQEIRHEFVQSYKDNTVSSDDDDESLEVETIDPLLREIDAELEDSLIDDGANESSDDVSDSDEE